MTWLKKGEPTEAWEIEDEEKIGDLRLASQIREICNSVADSAEAVSVLYYGPSTETKKRQIDRYERAKKCAEKKIEQISDKSAPRHRNISGPKLLYESKGRRERRKALSSNSNSMDSRAGEK